VYLECIRSTKHEQSPAESVHEYITRGHVKSRKARISIVTLYPCDTRLSALFISISKERLN